MCSLKSVIFTAVCLCWFSIPKTNSSIITLTEEEQEELVDAFNVHRSQVYPPAANMQKLYWSDRLARIAEEHARKCNYVPNLNRHKFYTKSLYTGENMGIAFQRNFTYLIWYWFSEGQNYNYFKKACYPDHYLTYTCDHYIQMVWAKSCEVGCAIVECPNLYSYIYYPYFLAALSLLENTPNPPTPHLVVCNYGPGLSDDHLYHIRPYKKGLPCYHCPEAYPLCDRTHYGYYTPLGSQPTTDGDGESYLTGLCYNEAEMCLGSDPHFAIRLPGGHLLCYNFQGVPNATFNLVSNKYLEMNALFTVNDANWDNTWLGAIGMTILRDGKRVSTLEFLADENLIRVGEKFPIPANSIKKLSIHNGQLTILEVPSNHTAKHPRIQVQLADLDVNFTIGFGKNNHLDLYWHSTGVPHEDSRGIVGQFFHRGVSLDADTKLLHVPGYRHPVPVELTSVWKFMEQSFHDNSHTKCWTAAYHTSQGAGIVEGSYKDYIVDGLLAVGH